MAPDHPPLVRTRLSILMFLQFFVWGGWGITLAGYASDTLGFEGWQVGWLMAVPALGAIISPLFVGLIADRLFATERVLCGLHLLGAACLAAAGFQGHFPGLMTCMMLVGLLFMPTIALANSLSFRHLPDPSRFPRVAVFGTIGWIASVLATSVILGGAATSRFLFQSAIGSVILALYCLTLPHTPPKGVKGDVDAFGLRALSLLKERSFLVFVVGVFLFSIPACSYFFTCCVPMLQQRGYPAPVALTSLNQFSELIFMFSMPWFVTMLGLKRVVMLGMLSWIVRYLLFSVTSFPLVLLGLALHGFGYSFFYVGSYMWVDKRAPEELKASAQSLLAFLLLGLGWFLGAQYAGFMMDQYPPRAASMAAVLGTSDDDTRPLPPWTDPTAATSAWRYLDLSATIASLLEGERSADSQAQTAAPTQDLGQQVDTNQDGQITRQEMEAIPTAGLQFGPHEYSREEMIAVLEKVASTEREEQQPSTEVRVTRQQWLAARSYQWQPIWLWPAGVAAVILVVFALAFRDKPEQVAAS